MDAYWQNGASTVWLGDNALVMAELAAAGLRFDLIGPTSPPYNLGVGSGGGMGEHDAATDLVNTRLRKLTAPNYYGAHDDAMPMDEYIAWQRRFTLQAFELLTEDGALAYQHKPRIFDGRELWPTEYVHPDLATYRRQTVILDRRGGLNFNRTYYVPSYEVLLIYARPKWHLAEGGWAATSVWLMPQQKNHWHPAPFDKSLPKRMIATTAPRLVLDPFMGAGTTLLAARELGVEAHGIEIFEPFAQRAVADLERTTVGSLPHMSMARTREREARAAQGDLFT